MFSLIYVHFIPKAQRANDAMLNPSACEGERRDASRVNSSQARAIIQTSQTIACCPAGVKSEWHRALFRMNETTLMYGI